MMNDCEVFNANDVYDNEVKPLIAQIFKICSDNKLPFLAVFGIASYENGSVETATTNINGIPNRNFLALSVLSRLALSTELLARVVELMHSDPKCLEIILSETITRAENPIATFLQGILSKPH